ncbi:MAG: hypothetical protein ACRD9S_01895 [Pyrinomonadaceae bacterium]
MTTPISPIFVKIFSRALLVSSFLILIANGDAAQTGTDVCHVYVVDIAKSSRALKAVERTESEAAAAKALSAAQVIFPEFRPKIGEEELTTKHYSFPGSKLIITASVFYTDESMASHGEGADTSRNDSMLIGITVSNRKQASALEGVAGNATTEVTYDEHTNKVRAKQYVKVRGRIYLVGIECDCMADKKSE